MFGTSLSATAASLLNLRFFRADFFSRLWLFIAFRRRSLPAPVTLKRFFAALLVFCFGISRNSGLFRWAQQHHHVASVEDGSGLDQLDLLDVDLRLVLPGELGLLLLLVQVLAVIHHPRDGRVCLGRHQDEVEVLGERVLQRFRGLLDPELAPVVVNQPDSGRSDRLVDQVLPDRPDRLDKPSRPQLTVTKPLNPPWRTTRPLQAAARIPRLATRLNPR